MSKSKLRYKISKLEVVLGAPDRVNIPCLMHDTRICLIYIALTNNKVDLNSEHVTMLKQVNITKKSS